MGSWIFRELYDFCDFLPSTVKSQDAKVMGSGGSSQAIHNILRISFPTQGAASGANLHPVPSDRVVSPGFLAMSSV